mmetsp:Transcript_39473/g.64252  ORF Transcript_39473/g.64252 Transcript_39473/m.64252 type:complete len:367 (+) Transcript_39473:751-1851(+)
MLQAEGVSSGPRRGDGSSEKEQDEAEENSNDNEHDDGSDARLMTGPKAALLSLNWLTALIKKGTLKRRSKILHAHLSSILHRIAHTVAAFLPTWLSGTSSNIRVLSERVVGAAVRVLSLLLTNQKGISLKGSHISLSLHVVSTLASPLTLRHGARLRRAVFKVFLLVCRPLLFLIKHRAKLLALKFAAYNKQLLVLLHYLLHIWRRRAGGGATDGEANTSMIVKIKSTTKRLWRHPSSYRGRALQSPRYHYFSQYYEQQHLEEYQSSIECAHALSRVFEAVGQREHIKLVNKYIPYVIHAYAEGTGALPMDSKQKNSILPGVFALLALCSEIEMKQMFANLDEGGKAVFKILVEDYKRTYKFTGDV